ncbi:MAG: cell division ATP-binding protein FtsE [Anaerovoracaceae bacterium]
MISLQNVTKTYKTNIGLDDVTIDIEKGEFVFLVGPSGAGKSTFIKLLLKEIDADSGEIIVNGMEVDTMSNREIPIHRRSIGIVFQDFRLLPNKNVYENVAFALEITRHSRKEIKELVPQVLQMVGVGDKEKKYPSELSAGEQQRVAIARAIVNKPAVIIADEPTGNLDPKTAWEIMKLMETINAMGTTIVMVTHARDIVDRMNKRVIAIEKGKVIRDQYGSYGSKKKTTNRFGESTEDISTRVSELLKKDVN